MRDRNNGKNIGVTESYKAAAFVVPITQPPYPPSQQTKFILNSTIQGVQRNDEHDMMLQQLVDSPQILRDRLQLDKERIKMVITKRNKQDGALRGKKRTCWTWWMRFKALKMSDPSKVSDLERVRVIR